MYIDVDTAIAVAVNVAPLLDDTDFKTIEEAVAYNAAGMDLNWNFITTAGVQTQTNVVPTTAGSHDWTHVGNGMYKLEITASAGTINNDAEGTGWFSGVITGVLPFVGPRMTFRAAALNDQLIDSQVSGDYPATRTSISNIGASTGGGLTFAPSEDNTGGAVDPSSALFVGSVVSGTFSSTGPGTTNSHSINDTGNDVDIVYGFQVGGNRQGTTLTIFADVDGGADNINAKIYNHVSASWETVGNIDDDDLLSIPLTDVFTGTGSELGKVYVRFETDTTTPSNLRVWECLVTAVQVDQSIGYSNGSIWVDTNNGTAGTENYVNGTGDNPSSLLSDAATISSSIGIKRFEVAPASSITFAASETQKIYKGDGWNLVLNGADVTDTHIHGAHAVSGICTASALYMFEHCVFSNVTLDSGGYVHMTAIQGTLTLGNAGSYHLHNCFADSNTGVIIDFNGIGASTVHIHGFEGKITFKNLASGHNVHCGGGGQVHTDSCTGGQIHHFGQFRYNDVGGNVTELQSDIEDDVDEILIDTATTIPATITTLTTNVATVDTVVDGIQTDLSNATDGLGAIKTAIDTANTDLANGTDGLGALKALIDTIDTVVDGIQTDLSNGTDGLGAIKTAVDTVDTVADSILVDTAEIGTAGAGLTDLGGMSTAMKAEVNVEALDVLVTDTHVQPTSVPAATSSIKDKINWLFTLARNKVTQTATTATLRNDDDDTTIATSTDSDDGTTATKGEWS